MLPERPSRGGRAGDVALPVAVTLVVAVSLGWLAQTRSLQFVLLLPPSLVITFWLLWLTHSRSLIVRSSAAAAWTFALVLTFSSSPATRNGLAEVLIGSAGSDELWTTTLQSPDQRIVRRQPIPTGVPAFQLRVRYEWDAKAAPNGAALPRVMARVNETELEPALAGTDPGEAWCCSLVWPVQATAVVAADVAEIAVWLPIRDPRVRFIAQRNPFAARFGQDGSLFFDGERLRSGVPHSQSGTVRPGMLHVWIEPSQ